MVSGKGTQREAIRGNHSRARWFFLAESVLPPFFLLLLLLLLLFVSFFSLSF